MPAGSKPSTFANEALLYVEPGTLTDTHSPLKRIFDIVVSAALLVITSPLFLLLVVLIKREDGGPVFFRQQRVGQAGRHFEMVKFRTMVVDAEARLAGLERNNQRSGPLFKLGRRPAGDPDRPRPAGHQPRRAAPADQRPEG